MHDSSGIQDQERVQQKDQDLTKGAIEDVTDISGRAIPGNNGMRDQLGHRDQDPMLKDADSDFPEPGRSPEHSGERHRKTA